MTEDYFNLITIKDLTLNDKVLLLFLINEDKQQKANNNIVCLLDYCELMLGISSRTIIRCFKRLKEKGYITSNKQSYNYAKTGKCNVYHVNYLLIKEKLGLNNVEDKEF